MSQSNGGTNIKKEENKQKMIVMEDCNEYWSKLQLEIDYAQ